jgi:hypothetical protein
MDGANVYGSELINCLKIVITALKFVIKIASNQIPLHPENTLQIS